MFSIITPTYNREKELPRVYKSLIAQTFTDFEWIIVDDGSSDNTANLVAAWISKNANLNITYHVMPTNQGKSYAVNAGLDLCKGNYTLIADSDDTFAPHTLQELKITWDAIEITKNADTIAAIWTLVEDENGNLVGEMFPKNFWQVSFNKRVLDRTKGVKGEKWHCWRSKVLKQQKMFVNPNSFISEGATWNTINANYDYLCLNVVHRKYWHSQDGLIHQKKTNLKVQKITYYTTFHQLELAKPQQILTISYFRQQGFNHIKSCIYYKDAKLHLKGIRKLYAYIAFILLIPGRTLGKILT